MNASRLLHFAHATTFGKDTQACTAGLGSVFTYLDASQQFSP